MPRWPTLALLTACALPENPAVTRSIRWSSPEVEAIARRACYDCHSNETVWKTYHRVPGINAAVRHHVDEGRGFLNFSTWDQPQREAEEAIEAIEEGEMPLSSYLWVHPEANLSDADRAALIEGLRATLAADPPLPRLRDGGPHGEHHED